MTKHLFNYCSIDWYEQELNKLGINLNTYTKLLKLDGIEQLIYSNDIDLKYKDLTIGTHLRYWPYWLDFWWENTTRLNHIFPNDQNKQQLIKIYQASNKYEWIEVIKNNICQALTLHPQYLVWHVSEANNDEIFTYDFHYTNKEVLLASSEVFNEVAKLIPENVLVLFENLWWPGLTLKNKTEIEYFFTRLNYKNVGIMLDTGHLMNTNVNLKNQIEGIKFLNKTIKDLGQWKNLIQGIHLNCSLSGQYQQTFKRKKPQNLQDKMIWQHITQIDKHDIFTTKEIKAFIQEINPQYVIHELCYDNLIDLKNKLNIQLACCR